MSRTRISVTIFGCICFVALTQSVWCQTEAQSPRAVRGNLNGRITNPGPMVVVDNLDLAQAALTTFGGTLTFKITITIKSTNLGSDVIECAAFASVNDVNTSTFVSSGFFTEEATVKATRTVSTATCTVNIPYSWGLANASTDKVSLGYFVAAFNPTTGSFGLPGRNHTHDLPDIKVPANGTTTTINAAATI